MGTLPEDVRAELARQRIELLGRERYNLENARRILAEAEAAPKPVSGVIEQARRAVSLAERTLRLGVLDSARVGAPREVLATASGLDPATIDELIAEQA